MGVMLGAKVALDEEVHCESWNDGAVAHLGNCIDIFWTVTVARFGEVHGAGHQGV